MTAGGQPAQAHSPHSAVTRIAQAKGPGSETIDFTARENMLWSKGRDGQDGAVAEEAKMDQMRTASPFTSRKLDPPWDMRPKSLTARRNASCTLTLPISGAIAGNLLVMFASTPRGS